MRADGEHARACSIDVLVFGGLLLAYIAFVSGYWANPPHFPGGDTLHNYLIFAINYGHYQQTGELPSWLPYTHYGMPLALRDLIATPVFYLPAIALGAALHIKDSWTVFRCLLILDAAVYSAGAYAWLRQFGGRTAAALATAA